LRIRYYLLAMLCITVIIGIPQAVGVVDAAQWMAFQWMPPS
jgi:hypothetical protein